MVDAVVVSDDASPATFDALLRGLPVPVLRHERNAGIARSLNAGLEFAQDHGCAWLLTVDQDSELPYGYLSVLRSSIERASAAGIDVGAVAAETVVADDTPLVYPIESISGVITTAEVFQSGTLWNVEALESIGGFDGSFGMDGVDTAACLALRQQGYGIVLAAGARLIHGYGSARPVRLMGRTVMSTRHSPERRTQMVRSRLRLFPAELRTDPAQALRSLRRIMVNTTLAVSVEDDRWAQVKATIRGLRPRRYR